MNNKFGIPDNIILPQVFEVRQLTLTQALPITSTVTQQLDLFEENNQAVQDSLDSIIKKNRNNDC